ncbi:hypothetical protein Tsubulata_024582 [Turnera subulata]|uniref:peroxidase n=1 Tax=Turnera subulata TaxID=218843 RepID=A0A9Q0J1C1_9ROSI|nr:hypothetical protein Tsubulata_024582 [Turnera subulata]
MTITLLLLAHAAFSLDVHYYAKTCPTIYHTDFTLMVDFVRRKPEVGPVMIKIMFEDCFVGDCDASILLDNTPYRMSEKKSDFHDLKLKFNSKGFTDQDIVALSGAYRVGFAKCQTVLERLYTDADMDK